MADVTVPDFTSEDQFEEWRSIPDHAHYEISNFGRVRSRDHVTETTKGSFFYKGRILQQTQQRGYQVVSLGTSEKYRVHLLVCVVFHGAKPSTHHEASFQDGDKGNCRASNLRWTTRQETIDNEVRLNGKHRAARKLTPEDVTEICRLRVEGMSGKEVALRFGISPPMVSLILNGKSWNHLKDAAAPYLNEQLRRRPEDNDLPDEEWRPVEENPHYEVSNLGRVRSLSRVVDCGRGGMRRWRGRIIKPGKDGNGYWKVDIGKDRTRLLHILVCIAFHGPKPSPDHEVAHWDDVKSNARADNLRWALKAHNSADRIRLGSMPRGETHSRAKITDDDVRMIRVLFEEGVSRDRIATRFGISRNNVYLIATHKAWSHVK